MNETETLLDVRQKLEKAIGQIGRITGSGFGLGGADVWFEVDGVEYFMQVKFARQGEK